VRYGVEPIEAEFVFRVNRFTAEVDLDGRRESVHIPNTGRMQELLVEDAPVLLLDRDRPGRKTRWDLVAVRYGSEWVSVDSRVPNIVLGEAVAAGAIPELRGLTVSRPEHTWGSSRFDFLLAGGGKEVLLEVKGCTLVREDGLALFPDAPTMRGARHVRELGEARTEGFRSVVVVIIQRSDGRVFAPNDRTDPAFGDALRTAVAAGVEVIAYNTDVDRVGVALRDPVPVDLDALSREGDV
jgi:sugar fermentation stimulation protein A